MRLLCRLIPLLLLFTLCLGVPAFAQEDYTDQDAINDAQYEVTYEIELSAGQVITASTEATNGDLDTTLSLLNESGSEVAFNDDIREGNLNSELIYLAAESGAYTLVVSRFESKAGQTSGNYSLTIAVRDAQGSTPITAGENDLVFDGEINNQSLSAEFPITVEAGQYIILTAAVTEGELDTTLTLVDPSGREVAFNDDRASGILESQIRYSPMVSGTYTARVERYAGAQGESSGAFQLIVNFGAELGGEFTEAEDGSLIASGTISDSSPAVEYTVELTAGQLAVISSEAQSGDLDTLLTLIGPDGAVVAENDDLGSELYDSEVLYPVGTSGTYTIVASRFAGTGEYSLTVNFGEVIGSGGGTLSADNTEEEFTIDLEAGFSLLAVTETQGGELDTVLTLLNPAGEVVAVNDDWNANTLSSAVTYTTDAGGPYTLVVSRYEDSETMGNYTLTIASSAAVLSEALVTVSNDPISLSGPAQIVETDRFRIHYTLEGSDATTQSYVDAFIETLDEVYTIQHEQQGWAAPPANAGGLYDIYLANSLGEEHGSAMGFASTFSRVGDNPNTPITENGAAVGYLVVDNDFEGMDGDPIALMRATTAHEFHHVIQFGYDEVEPMGWYYEATASFMETMTLVEDEDATGYVAHAFQYPEVCLGSEEDSLLWYGNWTFLEFLNDSYGEAATLRLWENIAQYDNWQALEATLESYGTDLATAHALYRAKNLVLDYDLASEFGATVWLENTITDAGTWTFTGNGIQELAANYFALQVFDTVDVTLSGVDGLEVYAVGITGNVADVMALGTAGTVAPSGYDRTYLIVVNNNYDDNVSDCAYVDYKLGIEASSGTPAAPIMVMDASQFVPLGN